MKAEPEKKEEKSGPIPLDDLIENDFDFDIQPEVKPAANKIEYRDPTVKHAEDELNLILPADIEIEDDEAKRILAQNIGDEEEEKDLDLPEFSNPKSSDEEYNIQYELHR